MLCAKFLIGWCPKDGDLAGQQCNLPSIILKIPLRRLRTKINDNFRFLSYLRTHSKNCLPDFIEFDYFHVHVDSWCIWLKIFFFNENVTDEPLPTGNDTRWCSLSWWYVLELVFGELFCSNVDNNCVLTFDWFLSELTIWDDANKGTKPKRGWANY